MSSSGSKRRFDCLQPSRIPKPNPEASQDQAARAMRSKGSRIPLPSKASKPQFRRPDPTTTDKLITDYLSRHSVPGNASFSKQRLGRQPLASMENLQEALSGLQLAVKSSRQAYAPVKSSDNAMADNIGKDNRQRAAEAAGQAVSGTHGNQHDTAPQTSTDNPVSLQDKDCAQQASAVASGFQQQLHQQRAHDPGCSDEAARHDINPDVKLRLMTTMSGSTTATATSCNDNIHDAASLHGLQTDPGTPAAGIQVTIADRLTPYFTPSSLSHRRCHGSCSQPSPPGATEELWYTPNSGDSSACMDNAFCDDFSTQSHPFDTQISPGSTIDRADSPSLLYGKGSAFSKEILEESMGALGQWLTM
ncbi:hypothetical protein WJX77_002574 [Trebouxia sp. C0004]